MNEDLENAIQELKRVDHLFWVSWKYTRTFDVIRNTVERLINVYDFGLNCILEFAKEKKITWKMLTVTEDREAEKVSGLDKG